jgi:transcriptional regulator with XRE-family HTH domain
MSFLKKIKGEEKLRLRTQSLGTKNMIGARIEQKRKELGMKQKELLARLQINGIELNSSGLSKLEGQLRSVSDFELVAIAKALDVSVDWLLGLE